MSAEPILTHRMPKFKVQLAGAMAHVRSRSGLSPFAQLREMLHLARGPGKLTFDDYFKFELWRTDLTPNDKLAYVSVAGTRALNDSVYRRGGAAPVYVTNDKILGAMVAKALGWPVPVTLAVYSPAPQPRHLNRLANAAEISAFLAAAELPIFGKPLASSLGIGAMSLFSRSPDGQKAVMGDGRDIVLDDLAAEIVRWFAKGYIFQRFLPQHRDILALSPTAVSTLRLTTIMTDLGPEILYSVQRIAGRHAIGDNVRSAGELAFCALSPADGTVIRAQSAVPTDIMADAAEFNTHHLIGFKPPWLAESQVMVKDIHRMFPDYGILGHDVALGPDGPILIEINASPNHRICQVAFGRGLLCAENMELITQSRSRHGMKKT